jgi:hypothetical protein
MTVKEGLITGYRAKAGMTEKTTASRYCITPERSYTILIETTMM